MTHSEAKNVIPLFYIDDRDAINGHLYMVGHSIPDMGIINFIFIFFFFFFYFFFIFLEKRKLFCTLVLVNALFHFEVEWKNLLSVGVKI